MPGRLTASTVAPREARYTQYWDDRDIDAYNMYLDLEEEDNICEDWSVSVDRPKRDGTSDRPKLWCNACIWWD